MIKSILLSILFLLTSCNTPEKKAEKPISEELMCRILYDFYFLEAHFNELNSHLKDSIIQEKFNEVLSKHRITKNDFLRAQEYYNSHPEAVLRIEEQIKKTIQDSLMN